MEGATAMNKSNYGHHGNEGPDPGSVRHDAHRDQRPYWKRAHHNWFFWVGMVFVFAAITIYVMSDDLSLLPRGRPRQPPSGAVGK
jgi:hypothetical protein